MIKRKGNTLHPGIKITKSHINASSTCRHTDRENEHGVTFTFTMKQRSYKRFTLCDDTTHCSRRIHCHGTSTITRFVHRCTTALGSEENSSQSRWRFTGSVRRRGAIEKTREEDHCVPTAASVASSRLPLLRREEEQPQTLVALSVTAPPCWEGRRRRHQQEVLVWC